MRRVLALALPAAALAAVTLAPPALARPATADRVPLRAALEACETGPERVERTAAFTASMPARPGAVVLAMRFSLQRLGVDGWQRVAAPALERLERSDPGAPGFVFTKRVEGLYSPGRFRAVVRFEWRDARGDVVDRARRRTTGCRQPDWRPDLRPLAIALVQVRDGVATWAVAVRNDGRGPLDLPAEVALRVRDAPSVRTTLDGLEPGGLAEVRLATPACVPGDPLRVVLDAPGDVPEREEDDNVLLAACPA